MRGLARNFGLIFALAGGCLLLGQARESRADSEATQARVEMSTYSVALGLGYNWGTGTLQAGGASYTFRVKNVKLGAVGVSTVRAAGTVHHLNPDQVADFNGTYVAGEAGLVLGGGASVLTMVNQNGVVINLRSVQSGLSVIFGPGGMTLELD